MSNHFRELDRGSNVIEIRRTGGPGGWIQFDYLSLDVVPGTAALIPEPSTSVLAVLGLLGLSLVGRPRRRR